MNDGLLEKVMGDLQQGISVAIVGPSDAGKSYWTINTLIPALKTHGTVAYFKDGFADGTRADFGIFDEVETLIDADALRREHPHDVPYYADAYLQNVMLWHDKYRNFAAPCVYIISRNVGDAIRLVTIMKNADWDRRKINAYVYRPDRDASLPT